MKKTFVSLAGIVLVVLLVFACDMLPLPSSIEFKTDKFQINAPVKIGNFNLATVLSTALKDSFPEGFEIYDMVDYQGAQAFLIAYEMDLSESFNPDEYLQDLQTQMNAVRGLGSGAEPIHPAPIVIPKMTSDTIADKWFFFDMTGFFEDMQEEINDDSTPKTSVELSHPASVSSYPVDLSMSGLDDLPEFMVFKNNGSQNFDSVFVHTGNIVLKIWLEFDVMPADSNLTVELTGIVLKKGFTIIGNPTPQSATVSSLNNVDNEYRVDFDIAGVEIDYLNQPKFHLGGIESHYAGGPPSNAVGYTLYMQPQVENLTLSGARNLKIGTTREDVPDEIADDMVMAAVPDMLNADIADGGFRMTARTPPFDLSGQETGCDGMIIGYELTIDQEAVEFADTTFYGLGGTPLSGFSSPSLEPFPPGSKISGKSLSINDGSKIVIKAGPDGVTFNLCNDVYDDDGTPRDPLLEKVLPIKIDMGMNIDKLGVVRWKTVNGNNEKILPDIEIPPINFAGQNGVASCIRSITFENIELIVDFSLPDSPPPSLQGNSSGLPEELKHHIALKVSCSDLGFDDNNHKVLDEERNAFPGNPTKLVIADEDPNIYITADLLPVVGGQVKLADFPYMEFGPVDMLDGEGNIKPEIVMNIYAEVSLDYAWTEAEIDIDAAMKRANRDIPQGTYPENIKDATNLSEYGKYMHGITLGDNIQAKVFLGGPGKLIDIMQPKLDFSAQWDDDNLGPQVEPLLVGQNLMVGESLPRLPGKDPRGEWVYSGLDLPGPGQGIVLNIPFNKIISSLPRNLYFSYEMKLPTAHDPIIVTPYTFDDVEEGDDSKMKALLVVLVPMEFVAEPGGYFSIPGDMFGDEDDSGEDIFGRKNPGDSSFFTGINVKSLGINIGLDNTLFNGAYLHFDRDDLLFGPNGINVGNGGLSLIFTGEQQRIINENLLYPDIKLVYPQREILKMGRYCLPLRIVIAASGSYTLDLDDLLGSGN